MCCQRPLANYPNAHDGWIWARLELGGGNPIHILYMESKDPSLEPSSLSFWSALTGSQSQELELSITSRYSNGDAGILTSRPNGDYLG